MTLGMQPDARATSLLVLIALLAPGCELGAKLIGGEPISEAADEAEVGDTATSDAMPTSGAGSTEGEIDDAATTSDAMTMDEGFVPEMDWCEGITCEPYLDECVMCPAGEKCVAYDTNGSWKDNKCVVVVGDQGPGEPCTYAGPVDASDDCRDDSRCWNLGAQEVEGETQYTGTCVRACGGTHDAPQCPAGTSCVAANSGALALCLPGCSPHAQDCGAEQGCYLDTAGTPFCTRPTSSVALGQPCVALNECAAGSQCTPAESVPGCAGESCCAAYCDLAAPSCAAPGTECRAVYDAGTAPAGLEDLGVCADAEGELLLSYSFFTLPV